jgi:uncharacterized small protein (DUF1192 family)
VRGVHYILEAASSLLSVGELEDRGARLAIDSLRKRITITRNRKEVLFGHRHKKVWRVSQTRGHRAYVVQEREDQDVTRTKSVLKVSERLLHARLRHPGKHIEGRLNALIV